MFFRKNKLILLIRPKIHTINYLLANRKVPSHIKVGFILDLLEKI